jgi:hypothetical protein
MEGIQAFFKFMAGVVVFLVVVIVGLVTWYVVYGRA